MADTPLVDLAFNGRRLTRELTFGCSDWALPTWPVSIQHSYLVGSVSAPPSPAPWL
jgi:hypothetical protein